MEGMWSDKVDPFESTCERRKRTAYTSWSTVFCHLADSSSHKSSSRCFACLYNHLRNGDRIGYCGHTTAPILQLSRFHPASKPRLPRWRGRVTRSRCQVRPDVAVCISATGTLIVPPSIRPGKCGLRRKPDVVDQMKLPTGLGFAIAAQIHVSHSPKIIRLRARRLLPGCRSRSYAHREIPTRKRTSFHRQT